MKISLIKLTTLIITLLIFLVNNSFARNISLIRDSETEDLLKTITLPLAKAANLDQNSLKIYIVNDSNINAFVMSGQNIFVNTGLITKFQDPNILAGVIAHEIGHISAGHLARSVEAMGDINKVAILTYLAGIAAAMAADNVGDAPVGVLAAGTHITQRLALKHTRTQEESADKLALQYLKSTKNSPKGLMKLLTHFHQEEAQIRNLIDEYAITHPISKKRINYIKANLHDFPYKNTSLKMMGRMKYVVAKLTAFLEDEDKVLKYFNKNTSYHRYARSIAYFKKGELNNSLKELNFLLRKYPKNGYFHELKGQILYENGLVKESIKSYHRAIKLLPDPVLAKIAISGSVLNLKTDDVDLVNFAIKNLNQVKRKEENNPQIFQSLAKAYEKKNEMGKSYLALAEFNLLKKEYEKTKEYADLALENLKKSDKINKLKTQDILAIIKKEIADEDKETKTSNFQKSF